MDDQHRHRCRRANNAARSNLYMSLPPSLPPPSFLPPYILLTFPPSVRPSYLPLFVCLFLHCPLSPLSSSPYPSSVPPFLLQPMLRHDRKSLALTVPMLVQKQNNKRIKQDELMNKKQAAQHIVSGSIKDHVI